MFIERALKSILLQEGAFGPHLSTFLISSQAVLREISAVSSVDSHVRLLIMLLVCLVPVPTLVSMALDRKPTTFEVMG